MTPAVKMLHDVLFRVFAIALLLQAGSYLAAAAAQTET
jgi:hypothetical protein